MRTYGVRRTPELDGAMVSTHTSVLHHKEVRMATRIQRKSKPLPDLAPRAVAFDAASAGVQEPGQLDKIKEMIPGESTAVYLGGLAVIPAGQATAAIIWALIGLVITLVVKAQQVDPRTGEKLSVKQLEWNQIIVSAVAFVVWVYALPSGPFVALDWYVPYVATLLVLGYTYAMPQILGFLDSILK
jgi:hypothetical protein